jgi:hypothetical protein
MVEMGCRRLSMMSEREEIEETTREVTTRSKAAVAIVDPKNEKINGSSPEMAITAASASEPKTPPNPVDIDFPYPARISLKDEYIRVEAIFEPSHTPPLNPPRIKARARSISSRTLD